MVLRKLEDWMHEQQQTGRIEAAYGLVGGSGCSVMDVANAEEH
jgi:hypothetical protein